LKIDQELLREHRVEFSYLLNHYLTEHLVRVSRAFDGDLTAAVVLGTIAHHNFRRFHEEVVVKSSESMAALVRSGAHREYLRPCNAMSVAASTGVPRETVRRKIAWLIGRGWVRRAGRDQLFVEERVGQDFADFSLGTVQLFSTMLAQFSAATARRAPAGARRGRPTAVD
jgi:hypothetical protein